MNYHSGDHIKFEARDEKTGASEWMWLRVERVDDASRVVFGRLDSQPVIFENTMRLGQELAISFDNIRDHRKFDAAS
jgi:uncharacterized protein YegJ (DUF2314 family)